MPLSWVGLGYNVPVNPSKNRVYVWRKLKELGAGYFKQGVAILPASPQNTAKFVSLAAKIRDMGGDATLVEMRFVDPRDEERTVERFRRQSEDEYRALLRDCAGIKRLAPHERSENMKKVVKQYGKVKSRDYFRSRSHGDLPVALDELANDMAHVTNELGRQLRNMLDL